MILKSANIVNACLTAPVFEKHGQDAVPSLDLMLERRLLSCKPRAPAHCSGITWQTACANWDMNPARPMPASG
jgi:hypothetical protein